MMNEQNVSPSVEPINESVSVNETASPTVDTSVSIPVSAEPVIQEKAKTFSQDQVNIISADVKRRAEARLRSEYEAQLKSLNVPRQQEAKPSEQTQTQDAPSAPTTYTEEQIYNIVKQRQERDQEEYNQQVIANDFLTKVQAAGKVDKMESSGLGKVPPNHPLVPMLNSLDNVGDVIDDFDANPVKIANLLNITMLNPMGAFKELQAISNSIKRNKEALAKAKAPEPLNQLKPSSYGLGGGDSSISERRRNPAFRF